MLNRPESDETHTTAALPPGKSAHAPESSGSTELPEALRLLALVGTDEDPYKEGGPWAYADQENMRSRCFFITQNTHYDGVEILSLEQVQQACDRTGAKDYAYILHDRDTYSEEEIASGSAPVDAEVDDPKADHIHAVELRKSMATVGQIARAYGVPPQQVEKKPKRAFEDLVEYLTHEHPDQQEKGKHLYDRSEVITNVEDLWQRVDKHKENRKKAQVSPTDIFEAVSNGEMTPDDVRRDYRDLYVQPNMISHLKKLRADHLRHRSRPQRVVNVLITGKGGSGKDLIAFAVTHALGIPAFKTKSDGVAFEGYDGQLCVIFGDIRPVSLIRALGHPGAVYNALSPYPQEEDQVEVNIKYSSAPFVPKLNLLTCENEHDEFLNALAGKHVNSQGIEHQAEGKEQAYRRFPIVINVEKGRFTVRLNKGYFEGTRDYFEYITLGTFSQDLEGLLRRANSIADPEERAATINQIEAQTVAPVVDVIKPIFDGDPNAPTEDADTLLADFAHVGQPVAAQTSRINPPPMEFATTAQQSEYFSPTDFLCTAVRANPAAPQRAWLLDGTENGQQYRILQVQNLDGSHTNYVASMTYDIIGPTVRTTGALDGSPASVHTAVGNGVLIAGEPADSQKLCVTSQGKTYIWCKPGTGDDKDRKNLDVRVSANGRDILRVVSESGDAFPADTPQRLQRYSAALVDSATHVSLEQNVINADEAVAVINRGTWATDAVTDDELQRIIAAISAGGDVS